MTFIPLKRPFRGPATHHCKRCVMGETGKKIGKNAENVTWSVCSRVRVALNAVENTTKSLIFSIFADPSPHFHADNVRRHPPPPSARELITSNEESGICTNYAVKSPHVRANCDLKCAPSSGRIDSDEGRTDWSGWAEHEERTHIRLRQLVRS